MPLFQLWCFWVAQGAGLGVQGWGLWEIPGGATCWELGRGGDWSRCLLRDTGSRALGFQCCSLDPGAEQQQRAGLWQQLLIFLLQSVFQWDFSKSSSSAPSLALSRLWQTLQAVCLLLCGCSCSTSLYFTAAPRKRREGSHSSLRNSFFSPCEWLCPVCWFPAGQNEWFMKQQSGSAALHWTLLSKLNTSFSWALRSLNEFGICHLSAASGMCRHSKCLPNLWLYSCNLFFLPLP